MFIGAIQRVHPGDCRTQVGRQAWDHLITKGHQVLALIEQDIELGPALQVGQHDRDLLFHVVIGRHAPLLIHQHVGSGIDDEHYLIPAAGDAEKIHV